MQLRLLVVLETGETAMRVGDYLARTCGGDTGADLKIVLFIEPPGLPAWPGSGESPEVVSQRRQSGAEAEKRTRKCLADVRGQLLQHGVSEDDILEEIAEDSDQIVEDIVAAGHRHGCDTIVIARHHKSMVREFFEGGPEEKLLRHPTGFTVWLVE